MMQRRFICLILFLSICPKLINSDSLWYELRRYIIQNNLPKFNYKIHLRHDYINAQDKFGITLLMIAAVEGRIQFVQRLLELGADKDIRNDTAYPTAYEIALFNGHKAIVEMLR